MEKINWTKEIRGMGLSGNNNLLSKRLRASYYRAMNKGLDSVAALEYAKEQLRINLSKPVRNKVQNNIKLKPLTEEEILTSFDDVDTRNKEFINNKLIDIAGLDNLDRAWRIFKRVKYSSHLNIGESLSEVSRIIGKENKIVSEPKVERSPKVDSDIFGNSKDHELYDFVKSIDSENAENNLRLFKSYRSQGYRVNSALDKIRMVSELREFCKQQDIPISTASKLIYHYSNVEDIKKVLMEWKRDGKFGIDSETALLDKSENVGDNSFVIYNGNKVRFKRLISHLFADKLNSNEMKLMYSSVFRNYFNFGKTLDEAIEYGIKTVKFHRAKDSIKSEFPVDPDTALSVFEEYYLTEAKSFEEAMRLTKREIGTCNNNNIRIANCMDRQGYFKLADLFLSYLFR